MGEQVGQDINMNGKQAKKLRQLVRRKIKEDMVNYFEGIPKLRPKPKWIPKFVWSFFYWIVFSRNKAQKIDKITKS